LDTGSAVEYSLAVRVERADLPEVAVVTRDPGDSAIVLQHREPESIRRDRVARLRLGMEQFDAGVGVRGGWEAGVACDEWGLESFSKRDESGVVGGEVVA
jgi:hypothetical protein